MRKIIIAAVALFLLSGAASAGVTDMGGDIQVRGLYRRNFDLMGTEGSQSWFDSYLRAYIEGGVAPDVRVYFRMIGEGDWGTEGFKDDSATSIDLDLGYLELANLWGSPATVVIGRQELFYGEGFLIGRNEAYRSATYERSPRKAFDALKVSFDYEPFALDFFGSVIDEGYIEDSYTLAGMNLNYDYYDTAALDIGLFYKDTDGPAETIALSARGEAHVQRFPGLSVKAEAVPQIGTHSAQRDLSAFGGYAGIKYLFPHKRMSCVPHYLHLNYYYMTGDDGTGDYGEFDPMFNDMFYGEVNEVNPVLGMDTNARILNLGFGWNLSPAVTLGFNLYGFRRNEPVAGSTDFGEEIDVKLSYFYNPHTELVLTAGYFSPKPALGSEEALQLSAALKIAF